MKRIIILFIVLNSFLIYAQEIKISSDPLFNEVNTLISNADKEKASFFSPGNYKLVKEHYAKASDSFNSGKLNDAKEEINLTIKFLKEGIALSKKAQNKFKKIYREREIIADKKFDSIANEEFKINESKYADLMIKFEKNQSSVDTAIINEISKINCLIVLKGFKKNLDELKEDINNFKKNQKVINYYKARNYYPKSQGGTPAFNDAEKSINNIYSLINANDNKVYDIETFRIKIDSSIADALEKLKPKKPAYFTMNGFVFEVIEYTSNFFNVHTLEFNRLSGKAYVYFYCDEDIFPQKVKVDFKDLAFKPSRFKDITIKNTTTNDSLDYKAENILKLSEQDEIIAYGKILKFAKKIKKPDFDIKDIGFLFHNAVSGEANYTDAKAAVLKFNEYELYVKTLKITPNTADSEINVGTTKDILSQSAPKRGVIDAGKITINSICTFYKELPATNYGVFVLKDTNIAFSGTGVVVDFDKNKSYSNGNTLQLENDFIGIIFIKGDTIAQNNLISNTGYLKAHYSFDNAILTIQGFSAKLNVAENFVFTSFVPYGYDIKLVQGFLEINNNLINRGEYTNGELAFPINSVCKKDYSRVSLTYELLNVYNNLSIQARLKTNDVEICWGDLISTNGKKYSYSIKPKEFAFFNLSATKLTTYYAFNTNGEFIKPQFSSYTAGGNIVELGMSGITIPGVKEFSIYTDDTPGKVPIIFKEAIREGWINIDSDGVNAYFMIYDNLVQALGPIGDPYYKSGNTPFNTKFTCTKIKNSAEFMFVDSAVYYSFLGGELTLAGKVNNKFPFRDMNFTSTSNNIGGKIVIENPIEMTYWGVYLEQDSTADLNKDFGGILSVKTGQILLTSSGISEKIHFAIPFKLTWGSLLASGEVGPLIFNFGSNGQKFDGFSFDAHAIALSDYKATDNKTRPDFHIGGNVNLGLFNEHYQNIHDMLYDKIINPYYKRYVELSYVSETDQGLAYDPTDRIIEKQWGDYFGFFHFELKYDTGAQNGFVDDENFSNWSSLYNFYDAQSNPFHLKSHIALKSTGITIGFRESNQVGFRFGNFLTDIAQAGFLSSISGCVLIENNSIKQVVTNSELAQNGGIIYLGSIENYASVNTLQSPEISHWDFTGKMKLKITSTELNMNASMSFTVNHAEDYAEGDISGKIDADVSGSTLSLDGRISACIGKSVFFLQGDVGVYLFGYNLGGGFFVGLNVPVEKAWLLKKARDSYYQNALNDYLVAGNRVWGFYGYGYTTIASFDIVIASASIKLFAGAGLLYSNTPGSAAPEAVGLVAGAYVEAKAGVSIGILSASAKLYAALSLNAGYPLSLCGTIGLKICGCCCWDLLCACYDLHGSACISTNGGLNVDF